MLEAGGSVKLIIRRHHMVVDGWNAVNKLVLGLDN